MTESHGFLEAHPRHSSGTAVPVIRVVPDGQELYQLKSFGPEHSDALISPLPVPNHDPLLGTLWLAYCSASYLAAQEHDRLVPPPVVDAVLSSFPAIFWVGPGLETRQSSWWELVPEPPRLPARFYSTDPGTIRVPHALGAIETGRPFPKP